MGQPHSQNTNVERILTRATVIGMRRSLSSHRDRNTKNDMVNVMGNCDSIVEIIFG